MEGGKRSRTERSACGDKGVYQTAGHGDRVDRECAEGGFESHRGSAGISAIDAGI